MRTSVRALMCATVATALVLTSCGLPSDEPELFGTAGKSCFALAPGAWAPHLPEAHPRSEPITAADLTVVTENVGATIPTCSEGRWVFTVPATDTAYVKRRNEVMWGTRTGTTADFDRTTVTYRTRLVGDLGATATEPDATDWVILWQLHGRREGRWRKPLVALTVQQGRMGLTGGEGAWVEWFGPYENHVEYDITITAHLDTRPGKGWFDVTVDGKPRLTHWSPPGVPTLFENMDLLQHRSGIYRGSNGAPLLGVTQAVYMQFPEG